MTPRRAVVPISDLVSGDDTYDDVYLGQIEDQTVRTYKLTRPVISRIVDRIHGRGKVLIVEEVERDG